MTSSPLQSSIESILTGYDQSYSNWVLYGNPGGQNTYKYAYVLHDSPETRTTQLNVSALDGPFFARTARTSANEILAAVIPPIVPEMHFSEEEVNVSNQLRHEMMHTWRPLAFVGIFETERCKALGVYYANLQAFPPRATFRLIQEMLRSEFEKLP
jgi:hypothetical protein